MPRRPPTAIVGERVGSGIRRARWPAMRTEDVHVEHSTGPRSPAERTIPQRPGGHAADAFLPRLVGASEGPPLAMLSPAGLLQLQRAIGNRSVAAWLRRPARPVEPAPVPMPVQRRIGFEIETG